MMTGICQNRHDGHLNLLSNKDILDKSIEKKQKKTLVIYLLLSGYSDNLIPAGMLKQPSIATTPQTYRVPVGGDAELECKLLNLGDSVQLWKNGTRVISVGSLQVNPFSLLHSLIHSLIRLEMIHG